MGPDKVFHGKLTFSPLTRENWKEFEELFGKRGACANCWCMYYRLPDALFKSGQSGSSNHDAMKEIVWAEKPTGLLAFLDDKAVGWCALAPREDYIRLERSRVHKRIDNKEVWSVPCFFIHKQFRGAGLTRLLLEAVADYARKKGIKILEAYPVRPVAGKRAPDTFLWPGLLESFLNAGFEIVDMKSERRPMVRKYF